VCPHASAFSYSHSVSHKFSALHYSSCPYFHVSHETEMVLGDRGEGRLRRGLGTDLGRNAVEVFWGNWAQWRNDGVAAASSDGGPHWW